MQRENSTHHLVISRVDRGIKHQCSYLPSTPRRSRGA